MFYYFKLNGIKGYFNLNRDEIVYKPITHKELLFLYKNDSLIKDIESNIKEFLRLKNKNDSIKLGLFTIIKGEEC